MKIFFVLICILAMVGVGLAHIAIDGGGQSIESKLDLTLFTYDEPIELCFDTGCYKTTVRQLKFYVTGYY